MLLLCLKLFPWATFRRRKAGIKAHTMLDLRVGMPVFIRVTHAKTADVRALDGITPQPGAFYAAAVSPAADLTGLASLSVWAGFGSEPLKWNTVAAVIA